MSKSGRNEQGGFSDIVQGLNISPLIELDGQIRRLDPLSGVELRQQILWAYECVGYGMNYTNVPLEDRHRFLTEHTLPMFETTIKRRTSFTIAESVVLCEGLGLVTGLRGTFLSPEAGLLNPDYSVIGILVGAHFGPHLIAEPEAIQAYTDSGKSDEALPVRLGWGPVLSLAGVAQVDRETGQPLEAGRFPKIAVVPLETPSINFHKVLPLV